MIEELRDEQFCYVTTTGRKTGRPHEIEIWFVVHEGALFLMSGGGDRSDWLRNMKVHPQVRVRVGERELFALAEIDPSDADQPAVRRAMAAKYQGWEPGAELSAWARTALVVRLTPSPDGLSG